jgi:hypothetical protein
MLAARRLDLELLKREVPHFQLREFESVFLNHAAREKSEQKFF